VVSVLGCLAGTLLPVLYYCQCVLYGFAVPEPFVLGLEFGGFAEYIDAGDFAADLVSSSFVQLAWCYCFLTRSTCVRIRQPNMSDSSSNSESAGSTVATPPRRMYCRPATLWAAFLLTIAVLRDVVSQGLV